ncbi:hypothetical protein [Thermoflavimicrobium daqui]|uniref:Uncharacterized protein n=1 Tax=Thermoflavimicrobium daqui TaxID=2137476 RepID=A0A364K4S9_9BACL|nr:hypothetical protein [Thermoflavimicrobium daqui]RAL24384.1 hypothetical protein DL897_08645 [Thermoflavimicrobium daqui]
MSVKKGFETSEELEYMSFPNLESELSKEKNIISEMLADEKEHMDVDVEIMTRENIEPNPYETFHETRTADEESWEEDAWVERWRSNPEKYLISEIPPELAERMEAALRENKMKKSDFILKALEDACKKAELDKIRHRGLAEGDFAKLIKDPETGMYRCFPSDFFSEEELYGFEVIDGKYYQKRWEKTNSGWIKVNKGYFEATQDQEARYIKMVNNKPVGTWQVYPFDFFEDGWKWGQYNKEKVIEVKGRQVEDGPLLLDVYIDNERVESVQTTQEVHRIIKNYL